MPRRKNKCKIKIVPGPEGPQGPQGLPAPSTPGGPTGPMCGPPPMIPCDDCFARRVLKVQLEAGLPAPNLIEGFRYESTVQPPDWPVSGTFNYFRAEVLDTPGYAMGESFSVVASLVYADTVTSTQNKLVIAHYNNNLGLLDYHSAVSEIVGTEDYLIAQSVQEAAIGDFFYVAITPDTTDLINFNHNLASLGYIPAANSFTIPGDSIKTTVAGNYIACVAATSPIFYEMLGGGGGGGTGGTTKIDQVADTFTLGRGGAGGNGSGFFIVENQKIVNAGDTIRWTVGAGGAGGQGGDGQDGGCTFIKFADETVKVAGGKGGKSGDNGGSSQPLTIPPDSQTDPGCAGGGGGAPFTDGSPGLPGLAAEPIDNMCPATDGSTNPRNGGNGGGNQGAGPFDFAGTGGIGGSTAGPNNLQGSGGGGGGTSGGGPPGPSITPGGRGGPGGLPDSAVPDAGEDSRYNGSGGGGGGSAGFRTGDSVIIIGGANGGRGGDGSVSISVPPPNPP